MKNRLLFLIFILSLGFSVQAQFANDWIDYNQRYFRIPVITDGLHRITQAQMVAAGIPSNIQPNRFQLFRKGEELSINVISQSNIVTAIEFYANKNDGVNDEALYKTAEDQPHQFYSLYTDTASYFLTWKITSGATKRMDTDASLTPASVETHHLAEIFQIEKAQYSAGDKYGSRNELSSGIFDLGEGFTGTSRGKNQVSNFTLNITNQNELAGVKPQLEMLVQGRNNLAHRAVIYIGPSGTSLRVLDTISEFTGFEKYLYNKSIEWSDFLAGQCVIQFKVLGYDATSDAQSISYLRITYPQTISVGATENKFFNFRSAATTRLYVRMATTNASTRIFDVSDPSAPFLRQTDATIENGTIYFSIADPSFSRKHLAVTTPISVLSLKESIFEPIDPAISASNYLIISHEKLMIPASNGLDPVQAYADYREQDYNVLISEIHDIYDQFNYGDPSPLAIKNYLKYAISRSQIDYLFLIGKGMLLNYNFHRKSTFTDGTTMHHYIPTYGLPGSDALFSVGLSDTYIPAIPTGRLNVRSNEELKIYLDKIKEMESLGYDELWRKNIIQLSGGQTLTELNAFAAYINAFKSVVESDFLGGKASNRGKSSASIDLINIADPVDKGVSLITFFGHSTSTTTDIDVGELVQYNNKAKYPVMYVNGCNGGSIFEVALSFGEEWLSTKDKGSIGVLAHSDLAQSSYLRRFSTLFYNYAFATDETFGLTMGDILELVQKDYFNTYGIGDESLSQVYGMIYQGDPAYKIFGAQSPDYAISNTDVFATPIDGDRIVSTSDSFYLNLVVSNFGRTIVDSLNVKISRTLSDGTVLNYNQLFERPAYKDTLAFLITNNLTNKNDGSNLFAITIDPTNEVSELNEANNLATFELFLAKGNTFHLFPQEYGVETDPLVNFLWQSADLLSEERSYSFQADTTSDFTSAYLISDQMTGQLLLSKDIDFSDLSDSTTIYWRTRFSEPKTGEDTAWVNSSFTIVNGSESGWGQFSNDQIRENKITGISYDEATNKWNFLTTVLPIQINNHAVNNANGYIYDDLKVIINGKNLLLTNSAFDPVCRVNTMNAVVFDRETGSPIRPFGYQGDDLTNPLVCGITPQMIHNFTSTNILGPTRYLDSLIKVMNVGESILLFSFDSVAYSAWDNQLKLSLAQVGIKTSTINALVDGQPAIFLGKKGLAEGEAIELMNNGGGLPVKEQSLELKEEIIGTYASAKTNSGKIGPAKEWTSFAYQVDSAGVDEIFFSISGITNNNVKNLLIYDELVGQIDLASIDANQYPYLELEFDMNDLGDQVPTTINNWMLSYQLPPEGILIAKDKSLVELEEGAPFEKTFRFYNASQTDFADSVNIDLSFLNVENSTFTNQSLKIAPPKSKDTISFNAVFSTVGKVGINNLVITAKAQENELYRSNNNISLGAIANISEDETNPVLDVTFDGFYILDGDIVSPSPRITIKFRDDNPYLFKEDTAGIEIALKSPCDGCDFERVNMSSGLITFIPASSESDFEINYNPGPLENGIYYLKVQGQDESGNASGLESYQISFEVINESTITHFYPYPNPFSTNTRFVFTLTGSEVPDELKIQIMTISGRVVREITQDEIGALKIGNNISEYGWDGRDEFGDQLANGVYLYKVFIRKNGERIQHRSTTADRAFKNGFGKIYLLK